MYFQRDYVLRMIEMLGELIKRLLAAADTASSKEELDEIAHKACGMPLRMLEGGDADMLAESLEEPQRFLAAELLAIDLMLDMRTQTDDMLMPLQLQILSILCTLREPDYMIPGADRAQRMVSESLGQLPMDTLVDAAGLFERAGLYAAAEDALFAAADQCDACQQEIHAFYGRLDAVDDDALRLGGLSREEVDEGRAALG